MDLSWRDPGEGCAGAYQTRTEEESLSVSGWLRGISETRKAFEKPPARNFVDLSKDDSTIEENEDEAEDTQSRERPDHGYPVPVQGVRHQMALVEPPPGLLPPDQLPEVPEEVPDASALLAAAGMPASMAELFGEPDVARAQDSQADHVPLPPEEEDTKPAAEEGLAAPSRKRSRLDVLEVYHLNLQALAKARMKKEAKASDFTGADARRLRGRSRKRYKTILIPVPTRSLTWRPRPKRSWSPGMS